jgi:hypothetical protein
VTLSSVNIWASWFIILIIDVLKVSELLILKAVKWESHFMLMEQGRIIQCSNYNKDAYSTRAVGTSH